jgi:DNA-binding NarL/FixJ family response regulator
VYVIAANIRIAGKTECEHGRKQRQSPPLGIERQASNETKRFQNQQKNALARGGLFKGKKSADLTSREMEVLQLIAEGKANKQTADELQISIKTFEKHRQALMGKLNIHDTAGLTRHAIAAGIIESSVQVTTI